MNNPCRSRFEIMIIDDEPADVELTRLALQTGRFDCNITVAINGEDALEKLRKHAPHSNLPTPDLIFLDLNMPRKNGKEVLVEMKADPILSKIPVVVLTTSDVERDVVASYQLGAAGYVTKPIDDESLFKAIRDVEEYWFSAVRRPA